MTGYAIVGKNGFSSRTIIGALMSYPGDVRELKMQVPASFETYNWLIEPSETLEQMYLAMVKRIRATVPGRIILAYTGSTDSGTIAYYFAQAGIDIEYLHYTQPLKNNLYDSDAHVDTKIRELEALHERFKRPRPIVHLRTAVYYDKTYNESIFTKPHFYETDQISHLNRNYAGTSSEMFRNIAAFEGQTVVMGLEKPKLHVDEYGIYWQKESEMYTSALGVRNYKRIIFFADQSAPEIFAKQAHEVLKYVLHNNPTRDEIALRLHQLQYEAKHYHTWCALLGRVTDAQRSLLSYLTKPNAQLPYGFGYKEHKAYDEFTKNRLKEHDPVLPQAYHDVVGHLLTLPTVNPLTDKFYVHRFAL